MKITVTQFMRQPSKDGFSIETVFADVRGGLPREIEVQVYTCKYGARGIWGKLYEIFRVCFFKSQVNHITGDFHFLSFLLPKSRSCLTFHDTVSPDHSEGLKKWIISLLWYRIPLKRAGLVVAVSEFTKQRVMAYTGCASEAIRVIHNPVSPLFIPKPLILKTRPRILLVGTGRTKNTLRILEALSGIDCDISIIGNPNLAQKEMIKKFNLRCNIYTSLSRTEVLNQYELSDLVVFASIYEGFGLPIIEAQAVGRPVVTSNFGAMLEVAGKGACCVDPFEVSSIREGILRTLEDSHYRESLVQSGFENIKRFSPDVVAQKYAAVYQELARQSR